MSAKSFRHSLGRLALRTAGAGAVLALVSLASASSASAAGYGPPGPTASSSAGGFTAVAASKTVSSSASKITTTFDGETYLISIPAGDFSTATQVTIYAPTDLSSIGGLAGIEVVFSNPVTGKTLSGTTFAHPIVVVVSSSSISKGDVVDVFNGSSYVAYTGTYSTSSGSATIDVTSDPTFAVVPSPKVLPGATGVHTGEPFLGEELAAGVAGILGLAAIGLAFGLRRRQTA
jgi:hypothetical protein